MKIPSQSSHEQIVLALAGNIEFGSPKQVGTATNPQNIKGAWWQGTSPGTANTDFQVLHDLGYVPTGYDVKNINKAAHVFQGVTPWTTQFIYLRSDQAGVSLTLFVH